jgi:hypothetical protein
MTIWYIFGHLVYFFPFWYQEKSGNPESSFRGKFGAPKNFRQKPVES